MKQLEAHWDLLARYAADVEESPAGEVAFTLTVHLENLEPLFRRGDLDRAKAVEIVSDSARRAKLPESEIQLAIEIGAVAEPGAPSGFGYRRAPNGRNRP